MVKLLEGIVDDLIESGETASPDFTYVSICIHVHVHALLKCFGGLYIHVYCC